MYQIVVIGLGITLLFGAGYYISRSDSNGILKESLHTTNETKTQTSPDSETIVEPNPDIPVQ